MKNNYPDTVINKILKITLEMESFAYISIDVKGKLFSQGGDLVSLGLPAWEVKDDILDDILFMSGFIPMTESYELLPSVHITNDKVADIHLFQDNALIWVVLVDKTESMEWQKRARQNSNELALLQQEVRSSKRKNIKWSEIEFFEVLNIMVFKLNLDGTFELLKPMASVFYKIYPELKEAVKNLQPGVKFPFIENFLVDAHRLWQSDAEGELIYSGPWVEQVDRAEEVALESKAVNWNGNKLLFIEVIDSRYQQHQNTLQLGREKSLQKSNLVKEVHKYTSDIRYLITHDSLTDLPNRYSFQNHLEKMVKNASRNKTKFALLFMDLDGFKHVNDCLGHDAGDELLKIIGQRLAAVLQNMHFVARIGGDEFCIIVEDVKAPSDAAKVARKCLDSVLEPIELKGNKIESRMSIGIAIFPDDGQSAKELLSYSDLAMYESKKMGAHQYGFYTQSLTDSLALRRSMESDLQKAVKHGEFILYYQPQVSLKTEKIIGVEALVRWQHPIKGMIAPDDFINILERMGLISELGDWVLRTACEQAMKWQQLGVTPLRMAVNISGSHFQQGKIIDSVKMILEETAFEPSLLELEITEDVVQTTEKSIETIKELKKLGITIALDDFGTGHSSLASLKDLPIDCLKIDKIFIAEAMENKHDAMIISAVVALGKALGVSVLVEGVETKEQGAYLAGIDCLYTQGYYFSRPVEADKIPALADKSFIY